MESPRPRSIEKIQKQFLPICLCAFVVIAVSGCIHPRESSHRPTDIDPKQATADYWLAKPAVASADWHDFNHLWDAAAHTARLYRFELDQDDPRQGVMTTLPLLSKQLFEVWRHDLPHFKDQLRSSIAEYRQIIRFNFQHLADGSYRVIPRVVIERHSQRLHRVTTAVNYQNIFLVDPNQATDYSIDQPNVPADYWYATGRDYALERDLAHEIEHRLSH